MYLRIINSEIVYPYTLDDLKREYPSTTFPAEINESMMYEFDIHEVRETPKPNDYTKNIVEETPLLISGNYYQNWNQTNASESEINFRISTKWEDIRIARNELLAECDWTQLSDISSEVKSIWSEYRQNLRDITTQSDPFNIVWPVKP